ncbi:MAG: hypothetical protein GEU81_04935 [Nitriliruptorales bacterium]|nr:hypothetical protein [Nitriliruptorales bacterium]
MSRMMLLLAGLTAALVLAGCSPGEPEVSPNEQVAADDRTEEAPTDGEAGDTDEAAPDGEAAQFAAGVELAFTSAPDSLPAGALTFELVCESLPHNVIIEGVQGDEPIVECPGEGSFTGDAELESGEYTYYCGVPGHREGGMEGTLTVS